MAIRAPKGYTPAKSEPAKKTAKNILDEEETEQGEERPSGPPIRAPKGYTPPKSKPAKKTAKSIFDEEEVEQSEERPSGVFDTDIGKEPQTIDVEPGKMAEPEERLKNAMLQGGGSLGVVTPDNQPVYTAQPAGAPAEEEEPSGPQDEQGMFDDLEDINERQKQEREAFADELESRRAEAEMAAQARAGLGGMGLSGATTALVGDVGRQEARAGDIAMADLARRQQQETFDELRRQASIWTFEEEFGVDLDGDGNEGVPPTQQERGKAPGAADPTKGGAISLYGNDGFPLNQPPENARLIDTRLVDGTEYDIYLGTDGTEYLVNKPQSGEEAQA